jgi:hypothetical protein
MDDNQRNSPALVAWVAEHVMGWKCYHWTDRTIQDVDDLCIAGGYTAIVEYSPDGDVFAVVQFDAGVWRLPPWNLLTDANDDLMVLQRVREEWLDADDMHDGNGLWNLFWHHLAELLRSRDPYYRSTLNQNELHYMQEYRCGDYCRSAALAKGYEASKSTSKGGK